MYITDTSVIESITPKYPFLNIDIAVVSDLFEELKKFKSDLASRRTQIMLDEQKFEQLETQYAQISDLFNIEYAKKNIEVIQETTNMRIINPDDARNKH